MSVISDGAPARQSNEYQMMEFSSDDLQRLAVFGPHLDRNEYVAYQWTDASGAEFAVTKSGIIVIEPREPRSARRYRNIQTCTIIVSDVRNLEFDCDGDSGVEHVTLVAPSMDWRVVVNYLTRDGKK